MTYSKCKFRKTSTTKTNHTHTHEKDMYTYNWRVCPGSYNLKSEMSLRERVWREIWKEVGRR